jgi:hypothetical protein
LWALRAASKLNFGIFFASTNERIEVGGTSVGAEHFNPTERTANIVVPYVVLSVCISNLSVKDILFFFLLFRLSVVITIAFYCKNF